MHVVQVSFFVDPERRAPSQLLEDWFSLVDIAGAVALAGLRVTVIQASMVPGRLEKDGVQYHFVAPDREGGLLTKSAEFLELVRDLCPDVFHVHGLGFGPEVIELRRLAPRTSILLQDHADRVPPLWRRGTWRRGAAVANGVSFCAREQADPFRAADLLGPHLQVFEIPEWTSPFVPGDQATAREATGVHGDPAILWIGHLNRNKDPLTVLDGVSIATRELPQLHLWCCYVSAPLLAAVQVRISRDAELRGRVHLLGFVPHDRMEQYLRAADIFVLGSRREGSSFSLIEALATGLTPVVTDIPSLRALTGDGTVGCLWPSGDSGALGGALRVAADALGLDARARVRTFFESHLSSAAIGRRFAVAYGSLVGDQRRMAFGANQAE